jgi:hypothetical protein
LSWDGFSTRIRWRGATADIADICHPRDLEFSSRFGNARRAIEVVFEKEKRQEWVSKGSSIGYFRQLGLIDLDGTSIYSQKHPQGHTERNVPDHA